MGHKNIHIYSQIVILLRILYKHFISSIQNSYFFCIGNISFFGMYFYEFMKVCRCFYATNENIHVLSMKFPHLFLQPEIIITFLWGWEWSGGQVRHRCPRNSGFNSKAPITTAADTHLEYFFMFFFFQRKLDLIFHVYPLLGG